MDQRRRTIITGGTRGIGAALARRLASRGAGDEADPHEVVALGRNATAAPAWPVEAGSSIRFDGAEATDATAVRQAFARANEDGAGLTGLVASASIWEPTPFAPLARDPDAIDPLPLFEREIAINVCGVANAVAAFLPHARRSAPCSIVLVGSTAGQRGEAEYAAYAASKAALSGLAKSWAVELAPLGIRVNVCAPGWVDTDMTRAVMDDAERRAAIEAATPRGRVASADDLAGPIAFLLGDDAAHVTGSVVSVNGGAVLASH